jgi:predicted acylesterase/phospholipase RssA
MATLLCGCALTHPPGPHCAAYAQAYGRGPASPAPVVGDPQGLVLRPSASAVYTRPLRRLLGRAGPGGPRPELAAKAAPLTLNLLLLSGGGEWGAYGSGFLNGLYGAPAHPAGGAGEIPLGAYNYLTGISTGALMTIDVWSAVLHARGGEDARAGEALADLKRLYSHADPQLFKAEPPLIYALASNGLADPRGRLEAMVRDKIARTEPLLRTDTVTQVEVGSVNLANGAFYSFQLPEIARADDEPCFAEVLLASAAEPLAFPPRFMDGEPYADGGIRYLVYADHMFGDLLAESQASRRPITLNMRLIINGNQSVNDPGHDAARALACDQAGPGQASACPPVINSLLGGAAGQGLIPRVAQGVLVDQIKIDSVYRLYTRWRDLGLPGSFKYTYVSNEELAHAREEFGLSGPCQTPATSSYQFDPTFEGCLYAIGLAKGAAGRWDFAETRP